MAMHKTVEKEKKESQIQDGNTGSQQENILSLVSVTTRKCSVKYENISVLIKGNCTTDKSAEIWWGKENTVHHCQMEYGRIWR